MAGAHISDAAAPMKMLLRVIRLSWLEIAAVIEPSCQSEGWRRSATFAVETATSHFRGNHLAAAWQVGEGASPPLDASLKCGRATINNKTGGM
jgi:hypothetical protein